MALVAVLQPSGRTSILLSITKIMTVTITLYPSLMQTTCTPLTIDWRLSGSSTMGPLNSWKDSRSLKRSDWVQILPFQWLAKQTQSNVLAPWERYECDFGQSRAQSTSIHVTLSIDVSSRFGYMVGQSGIVWHIVIGRQWMPYCPGFECYSIIDCVTRTTF